MPTKTIKYRHGLWVSFVIPISGEDTTRRNYFFRQFLASEDYKYSIKAHNEYVYYLVSCDDFIDAAKLQTWLDTNDKAK